MSDVQLLVRARVYVTAIRSKRALHETDFPRPCQRGSSTGQDLPIKRIVVDRLRVNVGYLPTLSEKLFAKLLHVGKLRHKQRIGAPVVIRIPRGRHEGKLVVGSPSQI